MSDSDFAARLRKVIKDQKINKKGLAYVANLSDSTLNHYLDRDILPGFDNLGKILKALPQVNARWLILNEGEPYVKENIRQE